MISSSSFCIRRKTLNSEIFKNRIRNLQEVENFNYLQYVPTSQSKIAKNYQEISSKLNKNFIQGFLEEILRNILIKNFFNQ